MNDSTEIDSNIQYYVFTPTGLNCVYWEYNHTTDEGKAVVHKCESPEEILKGFKYKCVIEGASLMQILIALLPIKEILGPLLHIDLDSHIASKDIKVDDDQRPTSTAYLEVYTSTAVEKYTDGDSFRIEQYYGFHLIEPEEDFPYSISLSPIYTIGHLPVKLNDQVDVHQHDHSIEHGNTILATATCEYTLYDVISAIIWEIGFYGGPADKENVMDELNESVNDINNDGVVGISDKQVSE